MRLLYLILFFSLLIPDVSAQQILPGTWSYRTGLNGSVTETAGVSGYHDMTSWNSGAFQEFRYHSGTGNPSLDNFRMNFRLLFPDNYDPEQSQKYPLIILLHGLGEAGMRGGEERFPPYATSNIRYWNNDHSLFNGGKAHLEAVKQEPSHPRAFPGFVLVPQNNASWDNAAQDDVLAILDQLLKLHHIDANRVYLHGYSNGGSGVWSLADKRPDLFAAILPISWVNERITVAKLIHMPIWHFQGEYDTYPQAAWAREIQKELRDAGATPRYTEYANAGHGIWDKAFAEPDFFSWMLSKNKTDIHAYFGNTEVCAGNPINIKLMASPGFQQYQWKKVIDGEEILLPEGTVNELIAIEYGDYFVRLRRGASDWTDWSKPLGITEPNPTKAPILIVSGSTVLPSLDGKATLNLQAPAGSSSYRWYKDGVLLNKEKDSTLIVNRVGSYTLSVTEGGGCPSLQSQPVIVMLNAPDDVIETPSDLTARAFSGTMINIFWNDLADNELGYEIYRSRGTADNYQFIAKTALDEISFQDSSLVPDTKYYYKVRAINNAGSSKPSNEAIATTQGDALAPTAPINLVKTGATVNAIRLTWIASTDNIGVLLYNIYINGNLEGTTTTTDFLAEGLQPETAYTFTVKAQDLAGNESESSNQLSAVTIFEGLTYKYYYGGLWNKVADYEGWEVEKSGFINNFNIGMEWEGGVRPTPQENYFAFDFEGNLYIKEGGMYEFSLRAASGSVLVIDGKLMVDNDGNHPDSVAVSDPQFLYLEAGAHSIQVKYFDRVEQEILVVAYGGADTGNELKPIPDGALRSGEYEFSPPPVAPTQLVARSMDAGQVDLRWKDNATDETGFEIYRRNSLAAPFIKVHTSGADVDSYSDKGLLADTTYYYRLQAINENGPSEAIQASAKTIPDEEAPSTPLNLEVQSKNKNKVSLSWDKSTDNIGIAEYIIYRNTPSYDNRRATALIDIVGYASGTSFTVVDLEPATVYNFSVASKDVAGNISGQSNEVNVTTREDTAVPKIFLFFNGNYAENAVQLDWEIEAGVVGNFTVERSVDDVNFDDIGTVGMATEGNRFEFTDKDPVNGLNFYRIRQNGNSGQENYSSTIVLFGQPEGMLNAQLYPVPANRNMLNLKVQLINVDDVVSIQVFDSYGKLYLLESLRPEQLQLPFNLFTPKGYGKGLYIVVIEQAGKKIKKKFIVN